MQTVLFGSGSFLLLSSASGCAQLNSAQSLNNAQENVNIN